MESIACLKRAIDSDDYDLLRYNFNLFSLLTIALQTSKNSPELSYYAFHLAHLKYPEVMGANSELKFDTNFEERSIAVTADDIFSELVGD